MVIFQEIDQVAEAAWVARRSGADANLERIQVLEAFDKTHPDSIYGAVAKLLKALSYFYHNRYDDALTLGEESLADITRHENNLWRARGLYVMGLFASSKNELPAALNYWKEGLGLAEAMGDTDLIGFLIYNIADMNRAIFKRYDLAKAYYKRGLKLCMTQDKHILCGLMLIGLSRCEFVDQEIELSLTHAERALELSLESQDDRVIGICYEFAGSRYVDLEQWEKGLNYLNKSLENRSKRNDLYGMVNSLCSLSIYHYKRGELEEALADILKSYELYLTLNTHVLDDLLFKQLALVYEARQDWALSSQYYRDYAEARNKSLSKELEDMMAIMAAEYEVESAKKDAEIYRLKTVALKEKNQEISLLAEELEQALEDLKETQGELVRTSRLSGLLNLIGGIAHEINTPLGNGMMLASFMESQIGELSTLGYGIDGDSRTEAEQVLQELVTSLRHLLSNLGKVSMIVDSLKKFNIFPDRLIIQQEDLKAFLINWMEDAAIQFPGVEMSFVYDSAESYDCRFEPTSFTRILTEIVTNSILHGYPPGAATQVEIRLERLNHRIALRIKDFGCGMAIMDTVDLFEPFKTLKQPTSGLGLGLHLVYLLTVNVLRGEVKLLTDPGQWTEVQLWLPAV